MAEYDRGLKVAPEGAPEEAALCLGRACALIDLGQSEQALAACDRGLDLTPEDASLWNARGRALWKLRRFEEALAAFDQGLELEPEDAWLWQNKGILLARHLDLADKGAPPGAQQCVCRSVALFEEYPEAAWRTDRRALVRSLVDCLDLPLLLNRLAARTPELATLLSCRTALESIERRVAPVHAVFDWLESPDCRLDECERLLLRGRLELHFGDPPAALLTFDKLDDKRAPPLLTDQVYLAWAMQECLCDVSAQVRGGCEIAREASAKPDTPPRVCFDAGQMLLLADDLESATAAFERAAGLFLPARLMALCCRRRLADESAARCHLDALLKEETRRLERGQRGLLLSIDPPLNDAATPVALAELEGVLERFECTEAFDLLRADTMLEEHPRYRELVERLGGGIDEWMVEYERRLATWRDLYANRDTLDHWREQRSNNWADAERRRLKAVLDWLETGAQAGKGARFAEHIAARVYACTQFPDEEQLNDTVRLLCVERRLPVDSTLWLILYIACRAVDLHHRDPGHAHHFAACAMAGLVGMTLQMWGVGEFLNTIGAFTGVGIVGDALLGHLEVWLRRRASNDPFPSFERFQKEMMEIWEQHGRPGRDAVLPPGT